MVGPEKPRKKTRDEKLSDVTLYTPREVSRMLKVHVQTLANWRAGRGDVKIPFIKIGTSVKYAHTDVLAFIEGSRVVTTVESDRSKVADIIKLMALKK